MLKGADTALYRSANTLYFISLFCICNISAQLPVSHVDQYQQAGITYDGVRVHRIIAEDDQGDIQRLDSFHRVHSQHYFRCVKHTLHYVEP